MEKLPDTWKATLRKATLCYPQPVAISVARVLRSRTPQEKVDACLKAAEIITRYLAAVSLSSYRVRDDVEPDKRAFGDVIHGPVSFGTFLNLVQTGAMLQSKHPAADYLSPFRPKKQGQQGKADAALTSLLELRNKLGHNLARVSEARSKSILANDKPVEKLAEALLSLEGIFSCPLFIVEDQQLAHGQIRARMMWLMGESIDPEPMELVLSSGVHELNVPYVSLGETVLCLWPFLGWDILPERAAYWLLIIDTVKERNIVCQTIDGFEFNINGEAVPYLSDTFSGKTDIAEQILIEDGLPLHRHWSKEKQLRVESAEHTEGAMPWQEFDLDTLSWYAFHLCGEVSDRPEEKITKRLFNDQKRFLEQEINQARLLFGTEATVGGILKRDMIDLRKRGEDTVRWDERHSKCANILTCLRSAVDFFSRNIGLDDVSMEGLIRTEGTADYLVMREALVNLFIHQDYTDSSAAAQVELQRDKAIFFNTGFSLVGKEQLIEGGRSQARNPLIARALRLIGFAELAGSGIRALQNAWRLERRKPPQFDSDREANTFTITLDWRLVEDRFDATWKDRLGVKLNPEHVQILNLALAPEGVNKDEIASGTGLSAREVLEVLHHLQVQSLLDERGKRYFVKDYLRKLLE
ncbi:ATP-binding protein [Acidobacteriota bacterium]